MQWLASLHCSPTSPLPVPPEEVHMVSLRVHQELFLPLLQLQPILQCLQTPLQCTTFGFLASVWPGISSSAPHPVSDPSETTYPVVRNNFAPFPWVLVWWHPSSFECHQRLCFHTSGSLACVAQPNRPAPITAFKTTPSHGHVDSTWRFWTICQASDHGPWRPWSIAPPNHQRLRSPFPRTNRPSPGDSSSSRDSATQQKCSNPLHTHGSSNYKQIQNRINQNLSLFVAQSWFLTRKQIMPKSSIELGLHSFMYGLHMLKDGWNRVKLLLIRRFLLESPSSFLASPDSPVDEAGSGPAMLHSKQSIPSWYRSSIPGIYNHTKWLGEMADLGIQMSPSLGILACLSARSGATLRKVGGEVKAVLWVWGRCPPPCSIDYFQPDLCASIESTMNYFYGNVSYSSFIGIYPYNPHHSKA